MTTMLKHSTHATLKDEVRGADIADRRLNKRLGKVVEELGANPNLSIPAATDSRAEMEAAYRFLDNDKVTPQKILQPHFNTTLERISQCDHVLLLQDTTELDLTRPDQQVGGAGPWTRKFVWELSCTR
jgi:Transposase DNA-binding